MLNNKKNLISQGEEVIKKSVNKRSIYFPNPRKVYKTKAWIKIPNKRPWSAFSGIWIDKLSYLVLKIITFK